MNLKREWDLLAGTQGKVLLAASVVLLLLIWLIFQPYQSHYISGLRILGDSVTQTYIGGAKEGRGDEWSTFLPFLKQAAAEGFPAKSSLLPYQENFDWFIGIPKAGFELIFLPNHILYWVVPAGHALSFQAFFYYALLVGSIVWLLRNLGVSLGLAFFSAVMLIFSQFYQVWWTSNFPALAASIFPLAIATSKLNYRVKFFLTVWAVGHLLFGQVYPPFYVSLAICTLPFLLIVKWECFGWKNLLVLATAAVIAALVFFIYKFQYIYLVSHTGYPGTRINAGGGSTWQALAGLYFPNFFTQPQAAADATYELSVAATILPVVWGSMLFSICWDRKSVIFTTAYLVILLGGLIYALNGVPVWIAQMTGLTLVPGRRMHFGLSVLTFIYCAMMISKHKECFSPVRMLVLAMLLLVASVFLTVNASLADQFLFSRYYYWAALVLAAVATAFAFLTRHARGNVLGLNIFLAGMGLMHLVVYGSFNPLMNAASIMNPVQSQLVTDWKALNAMNGNKPMAVYGNFGHLLRGEQLPALEAIHLKNVDDAVYDAMFKELPQKQRNEVFNSFVGIAFDNVENPDFQRGLTKIFSLEKHGVALPHEFILENAERAPIVSNLNIATIRKQGSGQWRVHWTGFLNEQRYLYSKLIFGMPCAAGSSWTSRFPIAGVNEASPSISLRGVAGYVDVVAVDEGAARQCVQKINLMD